MAFTFEQLKEAPLSKDHDGKPLLRITGRPAYYSAKYIVHGSMQSIELRPRFGCSILFSENEIQVTGNAYRYNPFHIAEAESLQIYGHACFQPDSVGPIAFQQGWSQFIAGGYPLHQSAKRADGKKNYGPGSYLWRDWRIANSPVYTLSPDRLIAELRPITPAHVRKYRSDFRALWAKKRVEALAYARILGPDGLERSPTPWIEHSLDTLDPVELISVCRTKARDGRYYIGSIEKFMQDAEEHVAKFFKKYQTLAYYYYLQRRVYNWGDE